MTALCRSGPEGCGTMRVLGIDTATSIGSVGLVEGGRVVAERSWHAASGHDETLAPLVRQLLADAGWSAVGLDAVAISIGPGSFTGLRIGLSLAKGLALAGCLAVVPVPTLDALAEVAHAEAGDLVCPILDARKGELYAALYAASEGGHLEKLADAMLVRAEDLVGRVDRRCRFLGDGVVAYTGLIGAALGHNAVVLPFTSYHPAGGVVAALGAARLAVNVGEPIGELEPYYVRGAYAEIGKPTGGGPAPVASTRSLTMKGGVR